MANTKSPGKESRGAVKQLLYLTAIILIWMVVLERQQPVMAATFEVTTTACTGPHSLVFAVEAANANPGEDIISFTAGLEIDAALCPPGPETQDSDYYLANVTESVVFEGNGATLRGHLDWIADTGALNPARCPDLANDIVLSYTPGFLRVGVPDQDNSGLTVTVRDLTLRELNSIARVESQAALVLEDVTAMDIQATHRNCNQNGILALEGADVTLRNNTWDFVLNFETPTSTQPVYNATIFGDNAGNLIIEDSLFNTLGLDGAIFWDGQTGSTLNIVSSLFENSQGLIAAGQTETNIVNSIWSPEQYDVMESPERLWNTSSEEMNITASTLLLSQLACDGICQNGSWGWIKTGSGAGPIHFRQSAVGVNFPSDVPQDHTPGRLLDDDDGGGFTADSYTWMQPAGEQNAADLQSITGQASLRTDPPGLATLFVFYGAAAWAHPLTGTPADPGQLIDVIDNAGSGEANELLNPIDNTPLLADVLGNPRVDGNGRRDIGAVQLILAPHLSVSGTADGSVDLSWTRPQDPDSGPITGYAVYYRLAGSADPYTREEVTGADTLSTTISGLTNGTEYELLVAGISAAGDGITSNLVTATPYGDMGAPVVSATPGDHQVALTWTPPDDGGHGIAAYVLAHREVGTTQWLGAQTMDAATLQATVTHLAAGTNYEFGVAAVGSDGHSGPLGIASATPLGDIQAPVVSATPGENQVELTWTQPDDGGRGIQFYIIQYRIAGTGTWSGSQTEPGGTLQTTVTGLAAEVRYEFGVAAVDDGGIAGPLGFATETPYGPMGAPVVTATPGDRQVTLSWPRPDDGGRTLSGYTIRWREQGTGVWAGPQTINDPDTLTTTISGLTADTTYEFAVNAEATDGTTGPEGTATATPYGPDSILVVIEKATNGVDADLPPGPSVEEGRPVQFSYLVTNVGDVTLDNVQVSDDQGLTVSCPQTSLAPGATMVCTAQDIARTGQYANVGTVTADAAGGGSFTDSDPSHYHGEAFPWVLFAHLRQPRIRTVCYMVADDDNQGSVNSSLFKYTSTGDSLELVNYLGVRDVEAMTHSLDGQTLYATNGGVLGTIDTTPSRQASFRPIRSAGVGGGNGALGYVNFRDLDGLAFDPQTRTLYATMRIPQYSAGKGDLLIKINASSGSLVRNGFGSGVDYVVIDTEPLGLWDIDDIVFEADGTLYAVAADANGGNDHLLTVDKGTGAVRSHRPLRSPDGSPVQEMEDLSYFNRNYYYGTTGRQFGNLGTDNSLYRIEKSSGTTEFITRLNRNFNGYIPSDFEALSCE